MPFIRCIPILIGLIFAGCAYQPVFNSDLVAVDAQGRSEYWVAESPSVGFSFDGLAAEEVSKGGRAVVEYVIDSNGRVTHVRVIESEPVASWGEAAQRAMSEYRYNPAPGNEERTPIIVTQEVEFREKE